MRCLSMGTIMACTFYQDNQLMYIGTCRSRTFFNRVVCHLDAYEHAWMNTLLRKVKDSQHVSLQEAATIVFEHFFGQVCIDSHV